MTVELKPPPPVSMRHVVRVIDYQNSLMEKPLSLPALERVLQNQMGIDSDGFRMYVAQRAADRVVERVWGDLPEARR